MVDIFLPSCYMECVYKHISYVEVNHILEPNWSHYPPDNKTYILYAQLSLCVYEISINMMIYYKVKQSNVSVLKISLLCYSASSYWNIHDGIRRFIGA